ncbi:Wzz/FepE/Etk N-terminal domain-containing protein [Gemmiger formicilis]|nr:Wzz/FepE/Etk N-terminal domain-containing protein [Gemmiger formicilis]
MENEGYETIDLLEVLNAVRQHLLAVILTTVILAGAGFGVSKFLITPQYEASALMIVNTRQDITSNVTSDQINSATKLVSTYSIIIKSDTVLQQVIDNLGLSLTYQQLASRVTVSAVDDTQVMKITVRSDNPEWARQVCEQITVVSPDVILESVEAGSVKVISSAAVNPTPVSPTWAAIPCWAACWAWSSASASSCWPSCWTTRSIPRTTLPSILTSPSWASFGISGR